MILVSCLIAVLFATLFSALAPNAGLITKDRPIYSDTYVLSSSRSSLEIIGLSSLISIILFVFIICFGVILVSSAKKKVFTSCGMVLAITPSTLAIVNIANAIKVLFDDKSQYFEITTSLIVVLAVLGIVALFSLAYGVTRLILLTLDKKEAA